MSTDQIRRWDSGALAHGVNDPFGQGPLPWLRERERYLEAGQLLPWYVDLAAVDGRAGLPRTVPAQRTAGRRDPGPHNADDVALQIKGFTSCSSAEPGGSVDFHVTVDPAQQYLLDIYRIGAYDGGATQITTSPRQSGIVQPTPLTAGRTVSCHNWWQSWRLQIPAHWRPGAYVAVLTTTADGYRSHVPFTVRSPRPADLLLVLPDVTWQAYNLYPEDGRTGASLYHAWDENGRLLGEESAAVIVSFDRPYAGAGLPLHVGHAYDVIRWAEREGYDLAYCGARDLHAGRVDPTRYRGLVFPGHDEYWTVPMRRAAERARAHGTSLVFLSANTMYWQVALSPSPSGAPDRLMICRKRRPDTGGRTALWRDRGEPEQALLGIQYAGRVPEPRPLVVRNATHWLWRGTGAAENDELAGLVAGEADRYFPRTPLPAYTDRMLLAHSPYEDAAGNTTHQETSLYRAPSGAYVFASGTFAWSPALDRPGHVHEVVRRATANLLDRVTGRNGPAPGRAG